MFPLSSYVTALASFNLYPSGNTISSIGLSSLRADTPCYQDASACSNSYLTPNRSKSINGDSSILLKLNDAKDLSSSLLVLNGLLLYP